MNLILIMTTKNVFLGLLRIVFAFFDYCVYSVASIILRIIFQLANFELTGFYESIEKRVYVILGIFMLFKITISLITYLVNPDKINDKEQGVSKVVTRIITVLLMLIMLPTFFSFMTEFQNKLLPVIPRIIVGTANPMKSDDVSTVSKNMAVTMVQAFVHKHKDCEGGEIEDLEELTASINDICSSSESKTYRYDYLPVISTIVGVAMCYCLFSMAIQVAIRAIKLIILRMMAPIPVISYIDPKSSKDGAFSHWIKTFMMTWGELFINLGILYFIVYIVDFMVTKDAWRGFFSSTSGGALAVWDGTMLLSFLMVGLFFFGKSAPKFIFDALGIKDKGNFVRMLGMGATAVGGIGATRSMLRARNEYDRENRKNGLSPIRAFTNFGKSLFSGLGAIGAGGNALLSTDKPTLLTGIDAQAKNNATALSRISSGSTFGGRLSTRAQTLFSGESDYDRMTKEKTGYESANKAILAYKNTLEKKALEKTDLKIDLDAQHKGINYLEFMSHTEGAKAGNTQSLQWFIDHGWSKQVQDGTENVWDSDSHSYVSRPKYKTVATWQDAQLSLDKIKDMQTQAHGKRLVAAVQRHEQDPTNNDVFNDFGTEYNDYRLASDAAKDVNLKVDFSTYGIKGADASKGDTIGIKQALGETNKHVTGVVTDPGYKAAKANAEATKK